MSDTYTPSEFAERLKRRGIVRYIADARNYVRQSGKESFAEADFEAAYHALNTDKLGRRFIFDSIDGQTICYEKDDKFGLYFAKEIDEGEES